MKPEALLLSAPAPSSWPIQRSQERTALTRHGLPQPLFSSPKSVSRTSSSSSCKLLRQQITDLGYTSFLFLEELFGRLRGESLLIATLAYGLAVRMDSLRQLRIRDVAVFDGTISIEGRLRDIPRCLVDDLLESLQERICGCEATPVQPAYSLADKLARRTLPRSKSTQLGGSSIRDDLLFRDAAFSDLQQHTEAVARLILDSDQIRARFRNFDSSNELLGALGRLHRRIVSADGHVETSALALFDKGPRIVRRGRNGMVDAYYLWRTSTRVNHR